MRLLEKLRWRFGFPSKRQQEVVSRVYEEYVDLIETHKRSPIEARKILEPHRQEPYFKELSRLCAHHYNSTIQRMIKGGSAKVRKFGDLTMLVNHYLGDANCLNHDALVVAIVGKTREYISVFSCLDSQATVSDPNSLKDAFWVLACETDRGWDAVAQCKK